MDVALVITGSSHLESFGINNLPLTSFEIRMPQGGEPSVVVNGKPVDVDQQLLIQIVTLLSKQK